MNEHTGKSVNRMMALALSAVLCMTATGCAKKATDSEKTATTTKTERATEATGTNVSASTSKLSVEYETVPALTADTTVTLDGSKATITGDGASYTDGVLTISKGGTYALSGTLTDGQIVVDSADSNKVYLMLNGVSVTSKSTAPLVITNAKRTILWLTEGSENSFADTENGLTAQEADETSDTEYPNATIYAKDDLVIAGSGTLNVTGSGNNGITGKDWVQLIGGTVKVTAVNHGIKGKDYCAINGADITIDAGGDGIKSTNTTDAGMGFVLIDSGTVSVTAKGDGISGETETCITGGTVDVTAGDASKVTQSSSQNQFGDPRTQRSDETTEDEDTVSMKGIKAGTTLTVTGGDITVNAVSHALHATGEAVISGGNLTLTSSNGKGVASHGNLTFSDSCEVEITNATEGIESKQSVAFNGGSVRVTGASDDGVNTGGDCAESDAANHRVTVSGGYLYIYTAGGDGIDSNGDFVMTGGTVVCVGAGNGGNSCLDCQYGVTHSGGTLLGIGAAQSMWAMDMSSGLSGDYIVNTSIGSGDKSLAVTDTDGTVLAYLDKSFSGTTVGAIYFGAASGSLDDCSFVSGGTYSGERNDDGFGTGGTVSGGTTAEPSEITGGMGGGMGGGGRPGGMGRP